MLVAINAVLIQYCSQAAAAHSSSSSPTQRGVVSSFQKVMHDACTDTLTVFPFHQKIYSLVSYNRLQKKTAWMQKNGILSRKAKKSKFECFFDYIYLLFVTVLDCFPHKFVKIYNYLSITDTIRHP
jgi:hypothetical protein